MGPPASPQVVAGALAGVKTKIPAGPYAPTWSSIERNYKIPQWFADAKFGIFMHWGLYSAAAHHNEWYEKHMYATHREWHAANFGPHEKFGYKDFIPLFTAARYDADEWASLFKKSGARFVVPTAQHHDNFALWDSDVTPHNAKDMGPKRDLIGEMAVAVRKQGMKFGVSNHGVENFTFVNPDPALDARLKAAGADLYDPKWAGFYNVADRSPQAMQGFLTDWVDRNVELIDKYQPDILWFDNGVNLRVLDPLKTWVAAYYYNRAKSWGKDVTLSTKWIAYAPSNDDRRQIGSVLDFEKVGHRSPSDIRPVPWLVDDTIGSTWGYTEGMRVSGPEGVLPKVVDTVAKGGVYMLNLAPKADGTIPQAQQDTLLALGRWFEVNGEAIYGSRPWTRFGEGDLKTGYRFTTQKNAVYAIAMAWPQGGEARIAAMGAPAGKVTGVQLLGHPGKLAFTQGADGLRIRLPAQPPKGPGLAYTFKVTGLKAPPRRS
jgi:alpha-L-fucosidase